MAMHCTLCTVYMNTFRGGFTSRWLSRHAVSAAQAILRKKRIVVCCCYTMSSGAIMNGMPALTRLVACV